MTKEIIQKFIMLLQKIIITSLLFIIYFAGFGITLIFIFLFRHKLLSEKFGNHTAWIEAEGYDADTKDALRQS